jgi:hypothetical protein
MTRLSRLASALGVLMPVLVGCEAGAPSSSLEVIREILPNGATLVRYAALPQQPTTTLEADLSIGRLEGEAWEVFGDVRGIEADPDGAIYVLDYQSREIQVFDPDGSHLRTLGGPGDGPGELTAANGLLMDPQGILWVNDHGKMRFVGLQPDGTEVARIPFPVQSYGFIWEGMRDREGRFWMAAPQRDAPMTRPEEGLNESEARVYMKSIHPETGAPDSVYVGRTTSRSFVVAMAGGGQAFFPVPFDSRRAMGLDPEGGFWRSQGEEYRITRLDARGDTVLVIEAAVPRLPVTASDRERVVAAMTEQGPEMERPAREIVALAPDRKPALDQLLVDEEGRLWVRRVREEGAPPLYDLFDGEGRYLGLLETGFHPHPYWVPTVRGGHAYFLVPGELEVPTVVRAPIPRLP